MEDFERINNLVEKYKRILSLLPENFIVNKGTTFYQAELGWDAQKNAWIINYVEGIDEYYIVHELGHPYLAKLCGFHGFTRPMRQNPDINWYIQPLFNILLDGFVDYQLSLINEIYPVLREKYLNYTRDIENSKEYILEEKDYIELLIWYLGWVQSYEYILRVQDYQANEEKIKLLLNLLKKKLAKFNGGITSKNFLRMTIQLKKFDIIKSSLNPKEIITYCSNVIQSMNLWGKELVLAQEKLFFLLDNATV